MPEIEIDDPRYVMGGTYQPTVAERVRSLFPSRAEPERAVAIDLYPVKIDDVSVWQGKIDFSVMRTMAQCVYIRAGYGNNGFDSYGEINAQGAKTAGMPWGLYWFAKPGKDFKKHVDSFKQAWQAYGGALPPVWDVEFTEYTTNIRNNTTNWLTKLMKIWQEQTGVEPMIYTRQSWWDPNTYRSDWPKQLDLWTAHYTSAAQPAIPADWGKVANPRTWTMWQWSADGNLLGEEHGVESASIDRNRFQGSIEQFNKKYKVNIKPLGDPLPPVEPPKPPVDDQVKALYKIKVATVALNVRGGPGVQYTDLGDLSDGQVLPVVEENGNWVRLDGWVNKSFVRKI